MPGARVRDASPRCRETIFGDAFAFLRDHVGDGVTAKQTIPSPSMIHYRGGSASIDPAVYPDVEGFWADLTAADREEVRRLFDLGCRYLQLDDTSLAYLNDPAERARIADRVDDAEHLHEAYIRHLNEALAGRPKDLRVTTHMCRGNFRDSWVAEGGYDFVAEALFDELEVDGFFLESKDALRTRLDEAARYLDLDQVCISPQCGFSSTVEGNSLSVDQEKAKLALLVELADEVWG